MEQYVSENIEHGLRISLSAETNRSSPTRSRKKSQKETTVGGREKSRQGTIVAGSCHNTDRRIGTT
jgi:hypothetical protein